MASVYLAEKNVAWPMPIALFPTSGVDWLASPTLAAGDFTRVGYDVSGSVTLANGNLANLPATTPAASGNVLLLMTSTEMNNDIVVISWKDAAGAEWQSGKIVVFTVTNGVDKLLTQGTGTNQISLASGLVTLADGSLTAAKIAADAITAAKIADGAIDAATFATGAINAAAIASDAITAAKIATDAITSAKIAPDAIGASELAADAVTEIVSAMTAPDNASIAAIKLKTDNLPSDPADASDITSAFGAVSAALATIASYIDTEVAAIKTKTDALPVDPASASTIAASFGSVALSLSTIAGYIDTEVAAIKTKTDTIPASPATSGDVSGSTSALSALLTALSTKLGTPAGVSVSADLVAIQSDTNDIQSKIGIPVAGSLADDIANISAGSAPTVADIDTQLSATHGAGAWGATGGSLTAVVFTYTLTSSVTGLPIPGVAVRFATDIAGAAVVWFGVTDTFGVARDSTGTKPFLEPGDYFVFRTLAGYVFSPEPDFESVS